MQNAQRQHWRTNSRITIGVLNITSRQQVEVVIGHPPMLMKNQDKVYDDIILYGNGSSINKLYQEDMVTGFSVG